MCQRGVIYLLLMQRNVISKKKFSYFPEKYKVKILIHLAKISLRIGFGIAPLSLPLCEKAKTPLKYVLSNSVYSFT